MHISVFHIFFMICIISTSSLCSGRITPDNKNKLKETIEETKQKTQQDSIKLKEYEEEIFKIKKQRETAYKEIHNLKRLLQSANQDKSILNDSLYNSI